MKPYLSTAALLLLAGSTTAQEPKAGALKVFVSAAEVDERPKVDDATKELLKKKRDEARQARKALEKQLKDELGKDKEKWPADKQELLFAAQENEALANADYSYRKIERKGLNDGVKDLLESLQGKGMAGAKEHAQVVASAGEADIAVEVMARRGEKTLPGQLKPDWCYLLITIGPGAEMKPERFAKVPVSYRYRSWKLAGWKIRSPQTGDPRFYFESSNGGVGSMNCYGSAANGASAIVNKFIEDNYAALTGR